MPEPSAAKICHLRSTDRCSASFAIAEGGLYLIGWLGRANDGPGGLLGGCLTADNGQPTVRLQMVPIDQ